MKILVANLGSTSFKYQLIDMDGERALARGEIERIGSAESPCRVQIGTGGGKRRSASPTTARRSAAAWPS